MSPTEIQKLSPTASASALRAREGSNVPQNSPQPGSSASPQAPQAGVNVDLKSSVSAGAPPVDTDRVQQIRSALRDGTYPIVPTQIADALIAARLMVERA